MTLTSVSSLGFKPGEQKWAIAIVLTSMIALLPILTIIYLSFQPDQDVWLHFARNVLPIALSDTLWLLVGVFVLVLTMGTTTAWIVTMYDFPGRNILSWALMLPLAFPTYITAYCYVEILDFSGPVQSTIRQIFGWKNFHDYWFPDIRSLPGAIMVLSLVLYPYVYLTARASFLAQSICLLDASRTLGKNNLQTLFKVALPLSRPAIFIGCMLALMECINDIGAVEFFGVQTLTVTIYSTWLNRGDLGSAAQIALVLLAFVVILIAIERWARRSMRFHATTSKTQPIPNNKLVGWKAYFALVVCAMPVFLGFLSPFFILISSAIPQLETQLTSKFFDLIGNSLSVATMTALVAAGIGIILAYAQRMSRSRVVAVLSQLSTVGYAIPGTVLALGVLLPLISLDHLTSNLSREYLGYSTGLIFTGSMFAIVLTCSIRFTAVSYGALDAGLSKVNPHLAMASRTLGQTSWKTLFKVDFPLIRPALLGGMLLVFVDTMKELPATILLRPFNFDTLAVHVYTYASAEQFDVSSLAALTIVIVGIIPVILLSKSAEMSFRHSA